MKVHKLVEMRNPWGTEKYSGEWRDSNLSEDTKTKLGHTNANDGKFYVPIEDYKRLFNGVVGLHYKEEWKRSHRMGGWDRTTEGRNNIKYVFNNPVEQQVSFQASAPQNRMFETNSCQSSRQKESLVFRVRGQIG